MAITIKEIHVRTQVVRTEDKEPAPTPEWIRDIKDEIIRELKDEQPFTRNKRER